MFEIRARLDPRPNRSRRPANHAKLVPAVVGVRPGLLRPLVSTVRSVVVLLVPVLRAIPRVMPCIPTVVALSMTALALPLTSHRSSNGGLLP